MDIEKTSNPLYGDAEARRRGVLDAAAAILDEAGYQALTIRSIAKRSGTSTGLIYQYFSDKQDVFAALLREGQDELADHIAGQPREAGVAGLLAAILPAVAQQWGRVGHLAASWRENDSLATANRDGIRELAASTARLLERLREAAAEAAAAEGATLREDPATIPFLWSGLTGVADAVANRWAREIDLDEFIDYSAGALARGITEKG
ncbi:TetR/AcrR family transcriptional regulator [Tomitella biformata]|uniref:TetR/AcrR family transcriptional regulator n=1 Tax=Tomitella biformata TaxID=630403 RepID=UPI0004644476|nr:TetR/AcrR family transcriptional regulator [Tomitella biformata]